jgi:hypothetical protein
LRYQLLTACAGALAEAQRRQLARAVMLVHEFITPATSDVNHTRNTSDLQAFLHRISGSADVRIHDGRLQGPFAFAHYPDVELFLGKVTRNLRCHRDSSLTEWRLVIRAGERDTLNRSIDRRRGVL